MLHPRPLSTSWHINIDMGQQPMWTTRVAVVQLGIVIGRRYKAATTIELKSAGTAYCGNRLSRGDGQGLHLAHENRSPLEEGKM